MERGEAVQLQIYHTSEHAQLISRLRRDVTHPVSVLATAVRECSPIQVATLFGLDHIVMKRRLFSLIADLDVAGTRFDILVGGERVTRDYLRNRLRRWHEISYDTEMETELELGEDNEEARRWTTGDFEYPPEEE